MHVLLHSVPPTLKQANTDPHLHWGLLDTHRQFWVSLLWDHCSFLLGPGAQGSICALQGSISQSCVSSGGSLVGLVVTSSKTAYAIPKSAAARASVPVAVHYWPVPPQEMLKHCSVSVSVVSLGPGAPKICLNLLSVSGRNGVWFWICPFYHLAVASPFPLDMGYLLTATAAPTILLGFLWTWTWAISSWPLATNSLYY